MPNAVSRVAVATAAPEFQYQDPEALPVADALRASGLAADLVSWTADVPWDDYDLVLVRSPWDYFDQLDDFLAWTESVAAVTRIVNPPSVIRWNAHKGYLTELGVRGVPVLPALLLRQGTPDAVEQLQDCGWLDVVIKPAVDGGARQALRADPASPEAAAHTARLAAAGDFMVQPYAPQIEAGEASLLFFGGEFSHAVRKVPAAGDYRVQAHLGGTEHRHEPTGDELATARQAMACAPGPLAYARVDLVEIDGVPTLMELEVIEPDLFFRLDEAAMGRFVRVLRAELD